MLLRRQKARQLEQKVCLGLELAPAFPEFGFLARPYLLTPLQGEPRPSGVVFWFVCLFSLLHWF